MTFPRSHEWFERGRKVIPGCSQTFSKGWTQVTFGASPIFLRSGRGCRVTDVDGHELIDYIMGLGPILLGYDEPAVTEAVSRQLREGPTLSLPHPLEVEVAELLTQVVPCAQMVRFAKNGSDATAGAVRLARAVTGRDLIACCGYHGWQDWYIGTTTRNLGVPESVRRLTLPFVYNDVESLARIFAEHPRQVAAIIMEPVGIEPPREGFLQEVQELARRQGAVLIFDEVLTGFRLAPGGAQEYFGVTPDLACFGKALANGYPLSAIVGRRELMEQFEEVFFSFTFGGETLSLAAAKATLTAIRQQGVVPHLWEQGQRLKDGYNALAQEHGLAQVTECVGLAPRTVIRFRDAAGSESLALKSLFQQEVVKRGVLCTGYHFICYRHASPDIEDTLGAYRSAMEVLASAIEHHEVEHRLEGRMVAPVFRTA